MEVDNDRLDSAESLRNGEKEPMDTADAPTLKSKVDVDVDDCHSVDSSDSSPKATTKRVVENGVNHAQGQDSSGSDSDEHVIRENSNSQNGIDCEEKKFKTDANENMDKSAECDGDQPNDVISIVSPSKGVSDQGDKTSGSIDNDTKIRKALDADDCETKACDSDVAEGGKASSDVDSPEASHSKCEENDGKTDKNDEKNDSEKENSNCDDKKNANSNSNTEASVSIIDKNLDTSNDDIEIIGESKIVQISSTLSNSSSKSVILFPHGSPSNSGMSPMNNRFPPVSSMFNSNVPGVNSSLNSSVFSPMQQHPGYMTGGASSSNSPGLSMLPQPASPPKPKSSLDQIELIRWEIQNRINTRPKYFKPNPTAELGPLAKFLFDIGSDLIKESVYHELVKIQSKKQEDDKLSSKEKEDLEKLKDIERDLNSTVGHLKMRLRKRCRTCHFQTESSNVMYNHKQYPHEDSKNLLCPHCNFVTKQAMSFKFHIEAEHNIQPRLHEKKFFYECDLCQYENNQEQKLNLHKARCAKQFRPLFNLHPSCLSGAEINLCLENIFYKPLVPKNLKVLQQKHLQQQAALAEARRQQAEVAALAAQKQAQGIKRQRMPSTPVSHFASPVIKASSMKTPPINSRPQFQTRMPVPSPPMSQVRFNSRTAASPARPTVANMLKDKQVAKGAATFSAHHGNAPVGFEVCEICGGYVKDRRALRIHFFFAHRIDLPLNLFDRNQPPLYCATCCVRFWTANGLRKHLDVHAQEKKVPDGFIGEGVSGKCIACGQLVGNIVVHMRVVHNREIHHYTNALMCMFCGASFNSHANVERHVKDTHGTIDIATGAVKMKGKFKSSPPPMPKMVCPPKKPAPANNSLVKGSVCVLCNLNFGRNVDLTRHCMRMHHTCMKCGMVVIDKASLLKHTCLSSPSGTRDCTMCPETGFHPAYYVKHLRDKHLKKFCIDIARLSVTVIERWTKRPYPFKKPPEECVEISDSDEDFPVAKFKVSTPSKSPRKKTKIGPASKINRPFLTNGVSRRSTVDSDDSNDVQEIPAYAFPVLKPFGAKKRKLGLDSGIPAEGSLKRRK